MGFCVDWEESFKAFFFLLWFQVLTSLRWLHILSNSFDKIRFIFVFLHSLSFYCYLLSSFLFLLSFCYFFLLLSFSFCSIVVPLSVLLLLLSVLFLSISLCHVDSSVLVMCCCFQFLFNSVFFFFFLLSLLFSFSFMLSYCSPFSYLLLSLYVFHHKKENFSPFDGFCGTSAFPHCYFPPDCDWKNDTKIELRRTKYL